MSEYAGMMESAVDRWVERHHMVPGADQPLAKNAFRAGYWAAMDSAEATITAAVHRADAAEALLREIGAYCAPIAPGLDPVGKALYERIGPLLAVRE